MVCDGAVEAAGDGTALVGVRADHERRAAVVGGARELVLVFETALEPDRERRGDALPRFGRLRRVILSLLVYAFL